MLIVIESTQVVANILSDSPLAAKQVNPVLEVEGGAGTRKPNQHRYPSFGTQHGSWKGIESKKKSVPTSHSPLQRLAKTQREALHDSDWHHTHLRSCRCIHEVISNYLSSSAGTMQELSPSRRCSGCPARSVYMTVWTKLPKNTIPKSMAATHPAVPQHGCQLRFRVAVDGQSALAVTRQESTALGSQAAQVATGGAKPVFEGLAVRTVCAWHLGLSRTRLMKSCALRCPACDATA